MADSSASQRNPSGSTPRSSIEASGPFHSHGLHFRFRSGSGITPREPTTSEPSAKDLRDEAVRSAKRFLVHAIRDDWCYPPSEAQQDATRASVAYTTRHEGASDVETENYGHGSGERSTSRHNPYKFEDPDSVGAVLEDRRRPRTYAPEYELKWNEGLQHWVEQRDAWTNATYQRPVQPRAICHVTKARDTRRRNASESTDGSLDRPLSTSSNGSTSLPETSSSIESVDQPESLGNSHGPWLPLYAPLLPPDNPVRANIKPAAYDHIYSKVVIQSLTPSLPIPLTHMTSALVEGWKTDGVWPPRNSNAASAVAPEPHKKRNSVMNAMRLKRGHNHRTLQKAHSKGDEHGTVRKSIDSVKKAFGLKEEDGDYGIIDDVETPEDTSFRTELNKRLLEDNK